jgi:hypothetical protein
MLTQELKKEIAEYFTTLEFYEPDGTHIEDFIYECERGRLTFCQEHYKNICQMWEDIGYLYTKDVVYLQRLPILLIRNEKLNSLLND